MLIWKQVSAQQWTSAINKESDFEINHYDGTYNLKIAAKLLENNPFDMPFDTLDAAKEKAEDLYSIFNEFLAGSGSDEESDDELS